MVRNPVSILYWTTQSGAVSHKTPHVTMHSLIPSSTDCLSTCPLQPGLSAFLMPMLLLLTQASTADKAQLLCCGKPCHKALPKCPHLCEATCHQGPCPAAGGTGCQEEVTLRCSCRRRKAKLSCHEVSIHTTPKNHCNRLQLCPVSIYDYTWQPLY